MSKVAGEFGSSSKFADQYEKYFIPGWFNELTVVTMDYAGDIHGKSLLDIATGTGIVPRFASKKIGNTGKIVGIDYDEGMLAVALRHKVPHTELLYGDAEKLPFDSASFDIVTCQQGFQFFDDKLAAAKEMHRVVKPGGRVIIATWSSLPENPAHELLFFMLKKHYSQSQAETMYLPFAYTDKKAIYNLFMSVGFQKVTIKTHAIICTYSTDGMLGYTLAGGLIRANTSRYQAFSSEYVTKLTEKFAYGPKIRFPMHTTFIVGRR